MICTKMTDLKTLVEGYQHKNYKRVKRDDISYNQTFEFITLELKRLVSLYHEQFDENQTAALLRDSIDYYIRRYHDYSIRGAFGGHYREVGVDYKDSVFEHVIPASSVRDMLIQGRLTVNQALNTPTCRIKKSSDQMLQSLGLAATSPNNWFFFQRYSALNSNFETYNGQIIDSPQCLNLEDHFKLFNIV